ncbi:MAG TPA: prenyltransferase [Candidatus Saccharimonadales bacterium]|nr:prenyltransferase [Candidatus Saccharimonadales bacterium]
MAKKTHKLSIWEVYKTSRPVWWITTAAPFVAGYLVVHPQVDDPAMLWIGTVYFAICYNLLMYGINDIFDYESDIRNPRKTGVLVKQKHLPLIGVILALNIPFWVYFVVVGGWPSTIWLVLMLFMVVAYSVKGLRFKEVPFLDSLTSSFHYTSPFIFGVLLSGGQYLWLPAWLAFFIWAMGNHALGAIQDIKPDREAGIASIATKLGAEKTIVFCLSAYIAAAVLPVLYYGWRGLLVTIVLLWYVLFMASAIPFRHRSDHVVFRRMWRMLTFMNYVAGGLISIYLLWLGATLR